MPVEFTWNGDKIAGNVQSAKTAALRQAAEAILNESNARVPVESGALKASGSTAVSGDEAAIGYSIVYAARQHEEIGWNHPNGGQAKYLETAFNAKQGDALRIMAQTIKGAIGA